MKKWERHNYNVYDFKDKARSVDDQVRYMLARTQSMFKYEGLPDTIPQRMLELMLQCGSFVAVTEVDGNLYAFNGSLGGEPDVYYRPTLCVVANPALRYNKELRIDEDCIIIPNDSLLCGLLPMFSRYASLITENELTMRMVDINTRSMALVSAQDERTKVAADKFFEDLEAGRMGSVYENAFVDGIKVQPMASGIHTGIMTQLIEFEQFLKGSWWQELGLQSAYNMKRESINEAEAGLNEDTLLPLVDDMLRCRQEALEKINDKYDTHISVRLSSSWEDNQIEVEQVQEDREVETDAEIERVE